MKTTQYVKLERPVLAADSGSIRARWFWGLRILHDPDAFAPGSQPAEARSRGRTHQGVHRRWSQVVSD